MAHIKKKKLKAFLTLCLIFFSILGTLRRNESLVLSSNTMTPLFHLRKSFHVSRSFFISIVHVFPRFFCRACNEVGRVKL